MAKRVARRDFVRGLGAAAAAGVVVGGAGGYVVAPATRSDAEARGGERGAPITLGSLVPVTGSSAGDGREMLRGQRLAVADLNAAGGVLGRQLRLVTNDVSDLVPDRFINGMRKLTQRDRALAVFAGYSSNTQAEFAGIAQAGMPFLHSNTLQADADAVRKGRYGNIFQTSPTEKWYGTGFLALVNRWLDAGRFRPHEKTIAIVTTTDPFSSSIASSVRKSAPGHGWRVSLFEQVTAPLADWGPTLAKIRAKPPGLIFHADFLPGDLAAFTKQFRSAPTPSLLYEQYGPSVPEYLDLAGDAADGVLWSTTIGTVPDDRGAALNAKYRKRFGDEPGLGQFGVQYDAVHLWAAAARQAGDPADAAAVCRALRDLTYRGVCGSYTFLPGELTAIPYPDRTDDNSLGVTHQTYQIQRGKQVLVDPAPYVNGTFQVPPWM